VRKACGRAGQVRIYCYGGRTTEIWLANNKPQFGRQSNLQIINLPLEQTEAMALLAQRTMNLQVLIQDGQITLSDNGNSVTVDPEPVFGA
jgi:uncharacterized protein YaeQ